MSSRTFLSLSILHFNPKGPHSLIHVVLTNYNFLSPLKRPRAVRNRSNNATPTPSKRANRLPVLPEFSAELGLMGYSRMCSSSPASLLPSYSTSPKEKRRSRYGKDEFAFRGASATTDESPSAAPRTRPRAPSSSVKPMRRSVRLSAFVQQFSSPAGPTTFVSAPNTLSYALSY